MRTHVSIVAALHIAMGILQLLFVGVICLFLVGGGAISGDLQAAAITGVVGMVLIGFFTVISLPGIIGGVGLLKFRNWARILTIVISVLNLFNFPFGTILGAYSLWVLFNPETTELFDPHVRTEYL